MAHPAIQLGIVGFGRMVELAHLPALKRTEGIEAAGVHDITPQRLDLAAKRGFQTYAELDGLLSSSIDAVLIATPHQSHYQLAASALRAGKHVLMEKPVTLNAAEALDLKKIARECGRTITVFHNRRFDSDYQLVKQVIADGELGPLLYVSRRHHSFGSGAGFGVKSFHPAWRNEAYYGGGALLDWGVHLIDQLLQLKTGRLSRINATLQNMRWQKGDVEDYVHAVMLTEENIRLSMEISFASHANTPIWLVAGEEGTLEVVSDREATLYPRNGQPRKIGLNPAEHDGPGAIYRAFTAHLTEGSPPVVLIDEAVETMQAADAMRQSSADGKEVRYDDFVLVSPSGV